MMNVDGLLLSVIDTATLYFNLDAIVAIEMNWNGDGCLFLDFGWRD